MKSWNTACRAGLMMGLVCLLPLSPGALWAQEDSEELEAEEVIVTATRGEEKITDVPASVTVIEQDDIQLGRQTLGMSEPLRGTPGIYVQNQENFSGDLRLSIRGFGARGRFGIQGIKILVDGIPETTPDGQTNIDSIDMGNVDRIEVLRGPSSSLYGASAGGVISIHTEDPPEEGALIEGRITAGSFGFLKRQVKFGQSDDDGGGVIFTVTDMEYGGFRDHSEAKSRTFNGKIVNRLGETAKLTVLINHYDAPVAEDPQGLTKEQVKEDRDQARPGAFGAETKNTGEEVLDGKTALIYEKAIDDDLLTLSVYRSFRKFTGRISPRFIEFERDVQGAAIQYNLNSDMSSGQNRLILGVDFQDQHDRRRNFDNEDGIRGDLTLNQGERAKAVGIFVHETFPATERLTLSGGLRNDRIEVSANDHFSEDGDQSGGRTFEQNSFSLGAMYNVSRAVNIYGNVGQAFEIPTLTQLDNPDGTGGFNDDLDPQVATSIEFGVKGSTGEWLDYDAALFQITAEDEIIVFQDPNQGDIDFFRNAGETERTGLELGLRFKFSPSLATTINYSYLKAEYTDFKVVEAVDPDDPAAGTTTTDFTGKKIPGLPENQVYVEVAYNHPSGFYLIPEALYVDEIEADDANSEHADAYTVVNLRFGYIAEFDNWPFSVYGGINNVTDEEYNQNIRINDFGGRFYEPAPPLNFYLGVSLGYFTAP